MDAEQIELFNSNANTASLKTDPLASIKARKQDIPISHGSLHLYYPLFSSEKSQQLLNSLLNTINWRQDVIRIHGREIPVPRLQAWYGDCASFYQYSGIHLQPEPWTKQLLAIKTLVEQVSGHTFNSVLINLYRDGRDSVSWHSDDEAELGPQPSICSISLGSPRRFMLRKKKTLSDRQTTTSMTAGKSQQALERLKLTLPHNSLLVMAGAMQTYWQHAVPKTTKPVAERINLTFRRIVSKDY